MCVAVCVCMCGMFVFLFLGGRAFMCVYMCGRMHVCTCTYVYGVYQSGQVCVYVLCLTDALQELSPTSDINLVRSLMNIHEAMMDEFKDEAKMKQLSDEQVEAFIMGSFVFAAIWSLGATTGNDGRMAFDVLFRELIAVREG